MLTNRRPFYDPDFGKQVRVIYRFGPFELDDAARELSRNGSLIEIEPKAFDLLQYLLQNRDRAVSKDELQTVLWPRSIVTEASLTRCVMKARRAVGDDADTQSVIRTLHSHGYRFVAELDEIDESSREATAERPALTDTAILRRRKPRTTHYLFAGAIVLIVALAVVLLKLRDPPPPVTSGVVAVLPVDNRVENEDLAWVPLGLMSLLTRMLEDAGITVVAERTVQRIIDGVDVSGLPDAALLERIRLEAGAGVVLNTSLDQQGGLYRLGAVVTYGDGNRTRRVIVGDSPAALAADMAGVVAGIVTGAGTATIGRFSKVSADPFVNELYARALDLRLQGKFSEARTMFQLAADQEPELFFLRYEIALCTRDLREWQSAEAQFDALHQEALAGDDARAIIVTLNAIGVMHFIRNNYDAAAPRFAEALRLARGDGYAADRASLHVNLALIAGRRGDPKLAKQHYEQALESFADAGQVPLPTFDNNYAGLLLELGELEAAQHHSEKAVEGFRVRGERRFEAPALNRLAKILWRRGDAENAISRHEQAMSIYRELGDAIGEVSVMAAMTGIFRERGDLTRARLNAREVQTRAAGLDDELLLADAYMQSAYVSVDSGLPQEALEDFVRARAIFEKLGDASGLRDADESIALAALALGDTSRALTIAQLSLEMARAASSPADEARTRWLLGRIALASGNVKSAVSHYNAAIDYARGSGNETLLVNAAMSLARLYLDSDNVDGADMLITEIRAPASARLEFMRLEARLAIARDERDKALAILSKLRSLAGEAWTAGDDALLAELDAAASDQ